MRPSSLRDITPTIASVCAGLFVLAARVPAAADFAPGDPAPSRAANASSHTGPSERAPLDPVSVDADVAVQPAQWVAPRPLDPGLARQPAGGAPRGAAEFVSMNAGNEGDMPRDVIYLPDGLTAVVVNTETDNVAFIDVNTRAVTSTVPVGDFPSHPAVTPDGAYVLVPNTLSHSVSVIDAASRTVIADIPISGEQPYRVLVTGDGQFAIVGVINDAVTSAFSILDLDLLTEVASFPTASQGIYGFFFTPESGISGALFTQFALTPDGSRIILPDRVGSQIKVYDRASGGELASPAVAGLPTGVDVSSDGSIAAVVHTLTPGVISKLDLASLLVTGSFGTVDGIFDGFVRITPSGAHAIAPISNNVIFVDLATGARTATVSTGIVGDIELSFDGAYAFVSNFNARVIDLATQAGVGTLTLAACADAATSPTERRAIALNNRFREDAQFYNINGAGAIEGLALTGESPEGDAPRDLAISADGSIAVVCFNTSRNVGIFDVASRTVRSYVDVGERPLDAAITPDGLYAVVCAADADSVRIIDLSTDTVVRSLTVTSRPARVRVSPDSQWAYVLNVAGTDRISFIQLAGAGSTIVSQLSAGQTGSAQGYTYTEISGIELSADGSTLAVCDSFNDRLRLYDTATRTLLASVTVGDFPIRVAFAPNGARAYVTNAFSDNLSVVNVSGAGSSLIGSFGNFDFPLTVDVDAPGAMVYVGNAGANPAIRAFNPGTNTFVATVPFASGSPRDAYLSRTDGTLYVASTSSELVRIRAAGAASTLIDSTPLAPGGPSDLVFDNVRGLSITAQPVPDGLDLIEFGCVYDLDGDRQIGLGDLSAILTNYGISAGAEPEDGDLDGDGDVDLADLSDLLTYFGGGCP